ncbi:MAG: Ig-like domain-containing protein [Paracoccaceae bacterium]
MTNNFSNPFAQNLVGLWDFQSSESNQDTGLADGVAQNGHFEGDAFASGDQLITDGNRDYFDVSGDDDPFDLNVGTIEVQFTQDTHIGTSPDTIVNRGEYKDLADEGYFGIQVTQNGSIEVIHCLPGTESTQRTEDGFSSPGDKINVVYSWDVNTGSQFTVTNLTTNETQTIASDVTGLTLDIGDNDDENFTFGSREVDDGKYDHFFNGSIDYVAIYDIDVNNAPSVGDGIVSGTGASDVIDADYLGDPEGDRVDANDALLSGETGDDDIILAGDGDDTVFAGAGDDEVFGGDDDDVLYGDSTGETTRESFEWDLAPTGAIPEGFVQNTGNVNVTFTTLQETGNSATKLADSDQLIDDIVTDGSAADANSSLSSVTKGQGNQADYALDFDRPVSDVSFRINDVDGGGVVRVTAFDAVGNPIQIELTGGDKVTLSDTDGVSGADTADSDGGFGSDTDEDYSVLVSIPGPVSRIVIEDDQNETQNSGINITDVYFDALLDAETVGDDSIDGGDGDDQLFGDAGQDTLIGGDGADFVDGGDDADLILGGAGDTVTGGAGGDDNDILDLTGQGLFYLDNVTPDSNGNGIDGTVVFVHQDGSPTGETITFTEIEEVIGNNIGQAPVAADDVATTDEDTPVEIDVLTNDSDPDGDTLTVTTATSPDGTVTINPDGTLTFTPDADFNGETTITYTVTDPNGNEDTGSVAVTVNPIDDAPVAADDVATTDEDTPVEIDVLTNDSDPDGDTLTVTSATSPDGTVTINPDGTLTFAPDADFNGETTITYTVTDPNGNEDTGSVAVTVNPIDDAPVAADDVATTDEDTPVEIDVLTNDSDPDGDTLTVTTATSPDGTVTINPDGTLTFTPDANFNGDTTITYTVTDPNGNEDTGSVSVAVNPVDDAPVAADDVATTSFDTPVDIDVLANDSDPDGDALTVVSATSPDGDVVINPDGTVTFDPTPGFEGQTTVTYTVEDPSGLQDTAEVTITVTDEPLDGIVSGTDAGEVIDDGYVGDPQGDRVDNGDAILPGAGPDDDVIQAGGGNDTIIAGDGDDDVDAGTGDDDVDGGSGDDVLLGQDGDDTLIGGDGSDTVDGGDDEDLIITGNGDLAPDVDYPGFFTADTDPENDRDSVDGGSGNDTISTGDDRDTIVGGDGNDVIDGGIDDDEISGDDGDDIIVGGQGSDLIEGGEGADTIYAGNDPSLGLDFLNIEDDGSNPLGPDLRPGNGRDTVNAGDGDDVVFGADDDDVLDGGAGNDFIDGEIDDDLILGGSGQDTLLGGQGDDTVEGGTGADLIDGGTGDDSLSGGGDADVFVNVNAGDTIDGGSSGEDKDVLDLRGSVLDGGSTDITFTGPDSNGNGHDGFVTYFDADGNQTGRIDFTEIEVILNTDGGVVPCFTPGTLIATPRGERRVEDLEVGDLVITRDNGMQEIRWTGAREMTPAELSATPHLRPVMIRRGALGGGLPERDMMVSPHHRVLLVSEKAELLFEEREVLVSAKHLIGMDGVEWANVHKTTYIHIMFDQHEVILSDGAWTESFQPGDMSLVGVGAEQRSEILELFPELETRVGVETFIAARRILKSHEAALLKS